MKIVDGKPYLDLVKDMIVDYTSELGRDLHFQNNGLRENFVKRFNELISESLLSIEEISVALKTDKDNIYHWKSISYRYMPSLDNLIAIADLFKCSLDYLIGLNNEYEVYKPNINRTPFSENLKAAMSEKRSNIHRLSKQINLSSTNQMYKWLKNAETPQIETIAKIACALDCSVDSLVGR